MKRKTFNSPQRRLHAFRESMGLTLREFADAVNEYLPADQQVSHVTVSNYEVSTRPGPRAEWLAALREAFPSLRLDWVISGNGAMTEDQEQWRRAATDERASLLTAKTSWHGLPHGSHSVFEELLSALMRTSSDPMEQYLELFIGEQIAETVYAPIGRWGFMSKDDIPLDTLRAYSTAVLNALTLIVADPGSMNPAELEAAREIADGKESLE